MDVFLFDLDGTLVNSIGDIVSCANIVRDSYGMAPLPQDLIVQFIGWGSRHLMARTLVGSLDGPDPSDAELDEAVARWGALYAQHMMDQSRLFPGIESALTSLVGPKAIVTNKPGESARQLCRHAGLDRLMQAVVGMGDVEKNKPDREGIDRALAIVAPKFAPCDRAVFVGDSAVDGLAAKAANLPFVGVTWGLGSEADLRAVGAVTIVHETADLADGCREALQRWKNRAL